jgi:predicted lipoprotein with Yx(FWY)xxD motif
MVVWMIGGGEMWRYLWIALVAAVVCGHTGSLSAKAPASAGADMPAGIRLVGVRIGAKAGERDPNGGPVGTPALAFADSAGLPIYPSKNDSPGKSACVGACLEQWHPVTAAANARPVGEWSVVQRGDGVQQWAFRGQPLYTFAHEVLSVDRPNFDETRQPPGHMEYLAGQGLDDAWFVLEVRPGTWARLPVGFSSAENVMAPGHILTTATGEPLYRFSGSGAQERKLPEDFRPLHATMLDLPDGDFTVRRRFDGTLQWAYRGAPLYTFSGDYEGGDLNGKGVTAGITPVILLRYFLPSEVVLQPDQKSGGRLVEARTGLTLYVRERQFHAAISNYARTPGRLNPVTGAAIGLTGCDAKCEVDWHPLLAPKDAQASGYWSVLVRPNGDRQWAYRGYALYTHPSEPPGTLYGAETWSKINLDHGDGRTINESHGFGLFWRAAIP